MARPGDENYNSLLNNAKQSTVYWFWTKPGMNKTICFLDDERITINQHNINLGEKKYETYTCGGPDCFFCVKGEKASTVEVYSILEILDKPYVSKKDQKERRYVRKMLAVKGTAKEVLNRRRLAAGGSLAGKKVEVIRDSPKSPSSGSDFELKGDADFTKIPADERKPFDYQESLAPLPVMKQKAIYQYKSVDSSRAFSDEGTGTISREDLVSEGGGESVDVPF